MDDSKKHVIAITAVIKNQQGDRILVIKRNNEEIMWPGKWTIPGGKAERGETVLDTLKREVLEEVGLEIEDFKEYLYDYTFARPDGNNVVGFNFLVKAKSESVKLAKDFDDYKWVTLSELKELDCVPDLDIPVKRALEL